MNRFSMHMGPEKRKELLESLESPDYKSIGKYFDALSDETDPEAINEIFGARDNFLMLHYGDAERIYKQICSDLDDSPDIEGGFELTYNTATGLFLPSKMPKSVFSHQDSGIRITTADGNYPLYADEVIDGQEHSAYTVLNAPIIQGYPHAPKGDLLTLEYKNIIMDLCQYVLNLHITTRIPIDNNLWRDGVNHVPKNPQF